MEGWAQGSGGVTAFVGWHMTPRADEGDGVLIRKHSGGELPAG